MEPDSGGTDDAAPTIIEAPLSPLNALLAAHGGDAEAAVAALLDTLVAGRFADEARPSREQRLRG